MLVAMFRLTGVAAALLLCACYNPTFHDCELTCTTDCPDDLTCDPQLHMCRLHGKSGACDTSGLDPNGDADSDGVKNGVDNCPTKSNPMQEDEDKDMVGDACDPCPISSNNLDSDGDGVGDVCDPNPQPVSGHTIADTIVFFDGFGSGANEPTSGTGSTGTGSGTAILDAHGGHFETLVFPLADSPGGETVTTAFTYTNGPSTMSGGGPMLLVNASNNGIACVYFASTASQGEIDIEQTDNQSYDSATPVIDTPSTSVHVLRIRRFPTGMVSCFDGPQSTTATLSGPQTTGGLFIQDSTAEFQYVMAVASGT